uniref:Uncharacterized protein n=1 Tax=Bursaphelenchus xylophilus TaxID=6326 RepID=A0A1I7S9Y9_BURXY
MLSWLIQATDSLNPAVFWILGLQIGLQLALICCLKRSGEMKHGSDHYSNGTQSSEVKPTLETKTSTGTSGSEQPKATQPSSDSVEPRRRSAQGPSKIQRRSSKRGVKQMIIEKSLRKKNIITNKAPAPKNREPIKMKDGGKSFENDIKTVKSTESNDGNKTNIDAIPSIDDQNQEENNTGEKTAEIRREAAELKPRKVVAGKTRNVRANPGEYPTMADVASDWGSAKEKKTKTKTKVSM